MDSVPVGSPLVTVTAAGFDPYAQNLPTRAPASFVTIVVVRANTMFESGGFLMYLPPGAPRTSVEFSCTSTATRTTAARSFADSFGSIRATSR
jgi:hypothetical protein